MALIIFLLPTLAMYYALGFIYLVIMMLIFQVLLISIQLILLHFPTYLLVQTVINPYSLPNSFKIKTMGDTYDLNHVKMIPNKSTLGPIFGALSS